MRILTDGCVYIWLPPSFVISECHAASGVCVLTVFS